MDLIITIGLLTIAGIGGLYTLGLIIAAIIGPSPNECECGCGHDSWPKHDDTNSQDRYQA